MAKQVRGSIRRNRLALAVAAALVPLSQGAQAQVNANTLPTGGNVTAGAATISHPGAFRMQIDQASDKAILQWQSFSIGSAAWVNFIQPSASAIALNRVLGNNPSQIFGRLTANGQVFLTNPNGVLFSPSASVDVGGLFATTLSIADSDFLAGRYNFSNAGKAGSVVNQGIITASGYAALAGPQVRNDGIIVANSGTVALAAGNRVALDMIGDGLISVSVDQSALNAAAINAGTIQADGGRVILTARSANALLDTVVNNSGIIRASSLVERNGEIVLDGGSAGVMANSGALQGTAASVTMTGDKVNVNPGSSIDATAAALTLAAGRDININAPIAGSMAFTASAGHDMTVASAINVGKTSVDAASTLRLDAAGQDARLTANGGQVVHAGQLTLHAENGHRAVVVNNGGDQTVSVGSGGIALEVVNGLGVAQIANNLGAATNGAQTVQTSGALSVVGGSGGGSSNSGVFQNQTGTQAVSADSITLQGSMSGNNGGAFIRNTNGGGDQTIDVTSSIAIRGGASGLGNRAGIQTNGNQTISGNADITLTGGSSGSGLNSDNTSNAALISANAFGKTQTIGARNITLTAGSGGTDTFAAITGNTQTIAATGDVRITGGAAGGDSNGARIGAPGSTAVGSDITLKAHDVVLTGGTSSSGAAIGLSGNSGDLPSTIKVTASGDVVLNSGSGSGSRIGAPNGSAGGGDIEVNAVNIALNGGAHQTVIRTTGNVKLIASGSISEGANGAVLANTLSAVAATTANLAGSNAVSSFSGTSGGAMTFTNGGPLSITSISAGGTLVLSNAGAVTLDASGTQDARITSFGGQTISADSLSLHAQDGRVANINNLGGDQSIVTGPGGVDLHVVSGQGVAQITNNRGAATNGTQMIQTTGALNVVGGSASPSINSGVFQMQSGKQSVTAASIALQGANAAVSTGGAFITNTTGGGDQEINVASGTISVAAGSVGLGNRAGISSSGNQAINGNADIVVSGGSSGNGVFNLNTSNSASISTIAGKTQTINAKSITVNAGSGGSDTFATIVGGTQNITATGDVVLNGGGGSGTANGARIGGATTTNLTLGARNLTLNAGATTGAGLGSSIIGTPQAATIGVKTTGDVILNASDGNGVRIGGSQQNGTAGGAISVEAGGKIELNGAAQPAAIRTLDNVALTASGSITENGNGLVVAHSLGTASGGSTLLGGPNQIAAFNAASGGDVLLTNTGALDVSGLSAIGSATLDNSGDVTLSGPWSSGGATSITVHSDLVLQNQLTASSVMLDATTGSLREEGAGGITAGSLSTTAAGDTLLGGANEVSAFNGTSGGAVSLANGGALSITGISAGSLTLANAGDVTVTGAVTANGATNVDVSGAFNVDRTTLQTIGGTQAISAGSLAVTGGNGRVASLTQSGPGGQSITVTGGSIDIQVAGGGGAVNVTADSVQDIALVNGDHININGAFGGVFVAPGIAGTQTIFATGTGRNAITVGSTGAFGQSFVGGGSTQTITAGEGAQSGSITIVGSAAQSALAGFVSNPNAGGTQTISTSGQISVTGGSAAAQLPNFSAGIFHNGSGQQTINAGGITVNGGTAGNGNQAFITSLGGVAGNAGDQILNVTGAIAVNGGSTGSGNRAGITSNADQTINGNPDIAITGGGNGSGAASNSTSNSAFLSANVAGRQQTIHARDITVNAGAGGSDTFAVISASHQVINANDVLLKGGGGFGPSNGARIGGPGGGSTDLTLNARNVTLNGGSTTGVGLGSSSTGTPQTNTITVNATGSVALNAGDGAGVRIGSAQQNGTAGGNISVSAGGNIALNGAAQPAAIRTLGNATLSAGGTISESGNGSIIGNALTTTSGGATLLGGPNQVASFAGTAGGALSLTDARTLTVSGPVNSGALTMSVLGNLDVRSIVSSTGGQTINAQGLSVTADSGTAQLLNFGGDQAITVTGGSIDVQTLAGGSASINNNGGGRQSIMLVNGDHIAVDGASGFAGIFSDATQVLSATGSGANAVRVGSEGALGPTIVFAQTSQDVTAGAAGESGSITIIGAAGQNALSGFLTNPTPGGTQTISTSGEISISGGSAAAQNFNTPAGIFHNGSGQQTIYAARISLTGGNAGNTNAALINALGGGVPANAGNQVLNVGAAGIHITAGSTGSGNRAGIFGSANQTIGVDGDIVMTGGAGGSGFAADNSSNNAFISDNGTSGLQTINARNIAINAGADGSDTFAVIVGPHQMITATNDVVLNGGGGFGTSNGARIGGRGGQSTDLSLTARNVMLNGGTTTGAGLGSSGTGTPLPNSVAVHTTGDVILNAGPGAGVRIGSGTNGLAGGNITVEAGGNIALNGSATQSAGIRTTDDVALSAGGTISESGNGSIIGSSLATTSGGATLLGGPNQVSSFSGTSGGAMTFTNSGPLSITNISAGGALTLSNAGAVTLDASGTQNALIRSVGGQSITADGLVLHAQDGRVANINNVGGDQSIITGAGGVDLSVVNGQGVAQIANNRGALTSGTQTIQTAGALNVVGGSGSGSVNSGVFQMQTGKQTVTAASIGLQGASSGNNGGAFITNTSTGGLPAGDQEINVAGGTISVSGGASGLANRAGISTNGNQTINGNPDIVVTGGASGNGLNSNNTNNSAFISANAFGKTQTINAGNITLTAGSGGTDTFATITSNKQDITATGDVRITGGAGGGDSNGARIGAPGSTTAGSDITLKAHDVVLTGGTSSSGAAIGLSGSSGDLPSTIQITASGDVVLNSGSGSGSRIGAPNGSAGGGDIEVNAVNIALNGGAHQTAIRTTGNVTLNASGSISEGANGAVLANALSTTSGGATLLGGPNSVSSFAALAGGDVLLNNTSALLSLGSMSLPAALTVTQAGDVTVGSATALAPTSIYSAGPMAIAATGSIGVRGSDTSAGAGSIVMSGDTLDIQAGSLSLLGGSAADASAIVSGSIINATLASSLTIDGGSGANSFAQVQTPTGEGVITLYFPNLSSGGYTVDGLPVTAQGPDGLFAAGQPATLGETLLLKYGF